MASKIKVADAEDILLDLRKIANDMSNKMAEKAKSDMNKAFDDIVSNYYSAYEPNHYHRHGIGGLYRALISSNITNTGDSHSRKAVMKVGSMNMPKYNKRVARYGGHDAVFDLIWNKGVRGLPQYGSTPLSHSFVYSINDKVINSGEQGNVWVNPYWNQKKYKNEFRTKIDIGSKTTVEGTPHEVLEDYVTRWAKEIGLDYCDKISKEY